MLFSSNLFLFLFLPSILAFYYLLRKEFRNYVLLFSSLFFYAWGEPKFVLVMICSIIFNYLMALLIDHFENSLNKRILLWCTVIFNLSLLFIYKYLDFFITNINYLGFNIPLKNIILPLGISFFTFQAMSYVIDVYRGNAEVQKNLVNVALYVSFFPQLVAGPIVRYQTIADQIQHRHESFEDFSEGVKRFIAGFSKKIILSNNMALIADAVFATPDQERSIVYAWMGAIAYTFQIFFDFSGYSDMAIGLGKMFGFHFLENFNYPYISKTVSEFWRRWHMSLGQWFRDYVYFPLGGSRVAHKVRLVFNLFVVWFLTGLWHGASWNFIFWGMMYFVILTLEKLMGIPHVFKRTWQKVLYQVFTLLCIIIGWVFFRSTSMTSAISFCKSMIGLTANVFLDDVVIRTYIQYRWFYLGAFLFSTPIFSILKDKFRLRLRAATILFESISVLVYLFILLWSVSFIVIGSHNPFIYFNF